MPNFATFGISNGCLRTVTPAQKNATTTGGIKLFNQQSVPTPRPAIHNADIQNQHRHESAINLRNGLATTRINSARTNQSPPFSGYTNGSNPSQRKFCQPTGKLRHHSSPCATLAANFSERENTININAQQIYGTSNEATRLRFSRRHQPTSSMCPARRKPEQKKKYGTAILHKQAMKRFFAPGHPGEWMPHTSIAETILILASLCERLSSIAIITGKSPLLSPSPRRLPRPC